MSWFYLWTMLGRTSYCHYHTGNGCSTMLHLTTKQLPLLKHSRWAQGWISITNWESRCLGVSRMLSIWTQWTIISCGKRQLKRIESKLMITRPSTLPSEYKCLLYHIMFDVKFDLHWKAWLVAGGNFTDPPKEDVSSGVVSMDTIRLGVMLAKNNDLKICSVDIGNAFLYGRTSKKCNIVAGADFGEYQGQKLIIHKGLYGLRISVAQFHEHLAAKLHQMRYKPSHADANLYMKDCGNHYKYLATYVDDILSFSWDPMEAIAKLRKDYILKDVGEPMFYLGGDIKQLGVLKPQPSCPARVPH